MVMKGGDGGPCRGSFGGCRAPLLAALLLLVSLTAQADGIECLAQFTTTPDTNVGDFVVFERTVDELTVLETELILLEWTEGVFDTPSPDTTNDETNIALQYLAVAEDDGARNLQVTVSKTLEGVPDYPDRKESLVLVYDFPLLEPDDDKTECHARMVFTLRDQNTQAPSTDKGTYTATVREDFPTLYTIPDLQVLATDQDGTSPNNVLSVTFNEGCPLATESPSFDADGGVEVPITFVLSEKLDYDTMDDSAVVTCNVEVSDQGTDPTPLVATLTISITVEPTPDETPQFEYLIYSIVLAGVEAPDDPLPVTPADLHATDADKPPDTLTYSMELSSGEDPLWNDYFEVNSASGAVTQIQDIESDLLGNDYSIHFIVTADDGHDAKGTSVLEIVLPIAPTTSTTSTTALSTTPSTTTSTTTTTTTTPTTTSTTTTPTTTTSTTAEPPSTTTCTPCDTTASTETTWTTPFLSTTTTTEYVTSTPTTTTTISTTIPTTTEPVTCTCPTFESTTSTTGGDSTTTTVDPSAPTPTITTVDPSAPTPTITTVDPSAPTPSSSSGPATAPPTSTTESPTNPQYRFEFQAYHFQPTTSSSGVGHVRVVQSDGKPLVDSSIVTYIWASETDGFELDQTTGDITMAGATKGTYDLEAQATVDGGEPLFVDVTITVVEPATCDSFFIPEGVIIVSVKETQTDITITTIETLTDPAVKYCITDVSPPDYEDNFIVSDQGEVRLVYPINADPEGGRMVAVRVEAQSTDDPCPKKSSGDLARNEVLVLVTIEDENDQTPVLEVPSPDDNPTRVGYPTNRGLQQVVGPVITLKAKDEDSVGSLDFSLSGDNANLFVVETDATTGSGALYLLDDEACDQLCDVTVSATDGTNTAEGHKIEVRSLDLSNIYDISRENMSPEAMEDYVSNLSNETGLDLHVLYFSLSDSSPATRRRRSLGAGLAQSNALATKASRSFKIQGRVIELTEEDNERDDSSEEDDNEEDSSWTSLLHIYGFENDGSLVTLDALNSALTAQDVQATEFSERAAFVSTPEEVSLTGWKAAVGVLGALVGVMLVAAIVGFVWYRRQQRSTAAKPSPTQGVATIGSAYPNHGYEDTEMNRLDTTSTSSGDSYKNSAFKKAMANGNIAGDSNNNQDKTDTGNSTAVQVIANPFTSVTVPESPIYQNPIDFTSPPRDTTFVRSAPSSEMSARESPYSTPAESSGHIYESAESDTKLRDDPQQPGGLRRITAGPLPDGAKSSPYLSKSEGDYEAFRASDKEKVASFTPYKGGEGKGSESPTLSLTSKPASPKLSSSYKPVYKPETFSYLDDVPRREVRDTSEKKERSDSPMKQTKLDTSPYAFPVRTKKEPPNLALAAPAKPIMKSSKDGTLISTSAEVHHGADDAATSGGGFSSVKGSPPPKQKAEERERKSSLKYYTSEGETSDSELKKSVAFKVLVDEKLIKRRKDEKEEADRKEKKESEKEKKDGEEETEDL